jgi:actin-related protein 8
MTKEARDKDRALAQGEENENGETKDEMDLDDAADSDEAEERVGAKVIVIHPGSQNMRIGFANDAVPRSVPMVIARKTHDNEAEAESEEPRPKRQKIEDETVWNSDEAFESSFGEQYTTLSSELKNRMRANKRRVLPNSKELVINYNRKNGPETIKQHNDVDHVEWTEVVDSKGKSPDYIVGSEALRIPQNSKPRYKLYWPIQYGWINENGHKSKRMLFEDLTAIVEESLKSQLDLKGKKEWSQYGVVFIIPDLYERNYVMDWLQLLLHEFEFQKVCFIQESLAATFGAGISSACIVDIGAQKTSVCCVEEGMCIENSRVNLKYGGADVTEMFIKMMLYDYFPYAEMDLKRRHDFLLADELKRKHCVMTDEDITVKTEDFFVREFGEETAKYTFRLYDETLLAPMVSLLLSYCRLVRDLTNNG